MKVKIIDPRITEEMLQPATSGSAGIDLRCCINTEMPLYPGMQCLYRTGIRVAIPKGYVGLITPRSGLGTQGIVLGNLTGVIDSDYRGEILVCLWNRNYEGKPHRCKPMDKIAQLIAVPHNSIVEIVNELDTTERNGNGFGSTDKDMKW